MRFPLLGTLPLRGSRPETPYGVEGKGSFGVLNGSNFPLSALICLGVLTSAIILLFSFNCLERLELASYDMRFRIRGPGQPSKDIIIVALDEASAIELQREKGQWSRRKIANAISNLTKAGAQIIGLDMVLFSSSPDRREDEALSAAIEEANNVVLARYVSAGSVPEVVALPEFQAGMIGEGIINFTLGRGAILRQMPFLSVKPCEEGLEVIPSFSLEVARCFRNCDFELDFSDRKFMYVGVKGGDRLKVPYPELWMNYIGPRNSYEYLPFWKVVKGEFDAKDVKGKIILLGSVLATDQDLFATPFSAGRKSLGEIGEKFGKVVVEDYGAKTPGVECHANAIQTILEEKYIGRLPKSKVIILVLLMGFFSAIFYYRRINFGLSFALFLIFACLLFGIGQHLFNTRNYWFDVVPLGFALSINFIGGIALQRVYSKLEERRVRSIFGRYVSGGVVKNILREGMEIDLRGTTKELTVLFSDIRGFTALAETIPASKVGSLLNEYFARMIKIVFDNQGTVDKLMGDAIMAFFGDPVPFPDHPHKAALTALAMTRELEKLNEENRQTGIRNLEIGIGINTGPMIVGNLGSNEFMDYTVVGDNVNLGSRLEGLNKKYGTSIIVSQSTYQRIKDSFELRELDLVRVRGRKEPVKIYELLGTQ